MIGYKPRRKGRTRMVDLLVKEAKRIARLCADVGHDEVELRNYCKIQERAQREWLQEQRWEDEIDYYAEDAAAEQEMYEEAQEYEREFNLPPIYPDADYWEAEKYADYDYAEWAEDRAIEAMIDKYMTPEMYEDNYDDPYYDPEEEHERDWFIWYKYGGGKKRGKR